MEDATVNHIIPSSASLRRSQVETLGSIGSCKPQIYFFLIYLILSPYTPNHFMRSLFILLKTIKDAMEINMFQ